MSEMPEIHYILDGMTDTVASTIPVISFHLAFSFVQDPAGICPAIKKSV